MHNPRGSRSLDTGCCMRGETDAGRGEERPRMVVPGAGGAEGAGRIKGSWSPEEDELLRDAVARHGPRNWTVISAEIPGRTGKSCRLRWCNQLSPGVHRRAFTPDEDRVIFELHSKHGNKWATIARKLEGRTDNSVKNHWNSTLRKRRRAAAAAAAAGNAVGGPVFAPAAAMSFQSVDLTKGGDDDDDDDDDSDGSVEPPAKRQREAAGAAVPPAMKLDGQAPPPDPPTSLSLSLPGTGAVAVTPPAPPAPAPEPPPQDACMGGERATTIQKMVAEEVQLDPRLRETIQKMVAEEVQRNPWLRETFEKMVADEVRRQMGSTVCSIMAFLSRAGLPTAWIDRAEAYLAGGGEQRTDG